MSAVTPDLYEPMYSEKVAQFFDKLLDDKNAGRPLMRPYLDYYFDMYWDLHLGVKGDAIPAQVRKIGDSFNTVLAYRDPTQKIVYENYMNVRANLALPEDMDRQAPGRHRQRQDAKSREDLRALLDQERAATASTSRTRMWCSNASTISWRSANGATRSTISC